MNENQVGTVASEGQTVQAEVTPAQASPEIQTEKVLSQHEVNELVGGAKQKGYQKGYQQALSELQSKQQQPASTPEPQVTQAPHQASSSMEEIARKAAAEEFTRQTQEYQQRSIQEQQAAEMRRVTSELAAKVNTAAEKYPDFNEVTGKIDFMRHFPDVLQVSNLVENAGDVLYDLAKNPQKIATLRQYMREMPPHLVREEVLKMSASIKANENALSQPQPSQPLNSIKPSNIGVDNGTALKGASAQRNKFAGMF